MVKSLNFDTPEENSKWFFARVVSDRDPLGLGRLKIRIIGAHSGDIVELPEKDLPWAQVIGATSSSGNGSFMTTNPDSFVFGTFIDGASAQIPIIFGAVPYKIQPSVTQSDDPRNETKHIKNNSYAGAPSNSLRVTEKGSDPETVFDFFALNGFTLEQAAGFVGNFHAESKNNPKAINPNDKGLPAHGLAQWRGARLRQLKQYASEIPIPNDANLGSKDEWYLTFDVQLPFTMWELANTEKNAAGEIRAANTAREAAIAICRYYERPENKIVNGVYTSSSLGDRIQVAEEALEKFGRAASTGPTVR